MKWCNAEDTDCDWHTYSSPNTAAHPGHSEPNLTFIFNAQSDLVALLLSLCFTNLHNKKNKPFSAQNNRSGCKKKRRPASPLAQEDSLLQTVDYNSSFLAMWDHLSRQWVSLAENGKWKKKQQKRNFRCLMFCDIFLQNMFKRQPKPKSVLFKLQQIIIIYKYINTLKSDCANDGGVSRYPVWCQIKLT